jgi:hypothetical protein
MWLRSPLQNLTLADTEELYEDIRLYLSLEKSPSNVEFWQVRLLISLSPIVGSLVSLTELFSACFPLSTLVLCPFHFSQPPPSPHFFSSPPHLDNPSNSSPAPCTSPQSMKTVCTSRLAELRSSPADLASNAAIEHEIANLLGGKTLTELEQLEGSVRAKLASGEPVDNDYWEGLLRSLEVWKAKVRFLASPASLFLRSPLISVRFSA